MNNKMMSVLDREWQQGVKPLEPFYNVVLNSGFAYSKPGTGAEIAHFRFDWTVLPDIPYEVHMTYIGEVNNITMTTLPMVYCDLGVPPNVYEPRSTVNAVSSTYLGFLEAYLVGASSYLHSEDGTNAPVYINGRPRNTDFVIRVLNNEGNPFTAGGATALGEYILTLCFIPRR